MCIRYESLKVSSPVDGNSSLEVHVVVVRFLAHGYISPTGGLGSSHHLSLKLKGIPVKKISIRGKYHAITRISVWTQTQKS